MINRDLRVPVTCAFSTRSPRESSTEHTHAGDFSTQDLPRFPILHGFQTYLAQAFLFSLLQTYGALSHSRIFDSLYQESPLAFLFHYFSHAYLFREVLSAHSIENCTAIIFSMIFHFLYLSSYPYSVIFPRMSVPQGRYIVLFVPYCCPTV